MSAPNKVIIIGASAAGEGAARALRSGGYDGELILIDADKNGSYERPPLSKTILSNRSLGPRDIALLTEAELSELKIDARFGLRVACFSPRERTVTTEDGRTETADAIILAVGAAALRPPIDGTDRCGVYVLRSFSDADKIRDAAAHAEAVAIIGGGLIGAEAAASLAASGRRMILIESQNRILGKSLPAAIASNLAERLRSGGVELILNAKVERLSGAGRNVSAIELAGRRPVSAETVLLSVGMAPNAELAAAAGLELFNGAVAVDQRQATSCQHVYAAGDVAAALRAGGARARSEHWRAAELQGLNAARAILGAPDIPLGVDWFWSDQGEAHVEMAGRLGAMSIARDSPERPVVFEFDQERLVGVASVNDPHSVRAGMRMIAAGVSPPRKLLRDPTVDLRALFDKQKESACV